MKAIVTILLAAISTLSFAQDKKNLEEIDAVVSEIKASSIPAEKKISVNDNAEVGMKTITYHTFLADGDKILFYGQDADVEMTQKGVTKKIFSSSAFFYHDNKLIKVEEFMIDGENRLDASWYFKDEKLIHSTLDSDRDLERAEMLVQLSKTFVEQVTVKQIR